MIKAIIFDLGNVLIDFDHKIAAEKISRFCDKSPQEIFDLFFDSEATKLFEEGKISPADFFQKVKEMLNLELGYSTFVPIWDEIFFLSLKNRQVFNLANQLRQNYKLALLSNINVLHFEYLKKYFPVFGIFHHVLTSFELGIQKPHQLVYQKTIEELGVLPDEVFYVDDRPELVESAKNLGIHAFVFKGVEQLKNDLQIEGVEVN